MIEIVRDRFPLVKIGPGDESFSLSVNGAMAPLENLYRASALHPEDIKHHVERWVVELLRAAEGNPDQAAGFDEVKERILPMIVGGVVADESPEGVVTQPLVEGLMVAYAIDNDRTIAYIPRQRFAAWGISLDQLHKTAIDNLVARSESISAHAAQDEQGRVNLILFQTMDGYDASRLLLPTLHDRLREHLGSPFAAGIPNRDILLCFRDDEETVGRLASQIAEDYQRMPHQVTDQLLLVTQDGIAPRP
ncbi:MAG TPA: DUF1444 family protein [Tepidisphaeraceae bacterium]|nr:DUF1444 family protein [Tepidisphaeraceae bacterium]